jgi:hypothetical protein
MIHHLLRYILEGVAGAVAADFVVNKTTGKHIHEHLFEWWCEVRDYIAGWLREHANLKVQKLGVAILDKLDGVVVNTKRMVDRLTLGWFAVTSDEQGHEICTREVSAEEAMAQFPELRSSPILIQELC